MARSMLLINKSQTASRDSVAAINTIELFFTSERERERYNNAEIQIKRLLDRFVYLLLSMLYLLLTQKR